MEHKIGTRITLEDGRVVEVVGEIVQDSCEGCIFKDEDCLKIPCFAEDRTDKKNIIYKEIKEKEL